MAVLYGIHAVEQALKAGRPLERLLVAEGRSGRAIDKLVAAARARNVAVRFVARTELDRAAGNAAHQSVVAIAAAALYADFETLIAQARKPALFVVLDGVEDPRNLGAVLRTAHCAGADGVIVPERRAAGITPAASKAAAGAAELIGVARITNLGRALEQLKEAGCWLVGLDETANKTMAEADFTGPVGIVLGGEGKGLHEHIRRKCDFLVSIPTFGAIRSLNVSVAAGVVLYEALRQRQAKEIARR